MSDEIIENRSNEEFEELCDHGKMWMNATENLIVVMYDIEKGHLKDAPVEAKLGHVANIITQCIWHASQAMRISRFHMELPDGTVVTITPTAETIPPKSAIN
jgi:hypothetical protein